MYSSIDWCVRAAFWLIHAIKNSLFNEWSQVCINFELDGQEQEIQIKSGFIWHLWQRFDRQAAVRHWTVSIHIENGNAAILMGFHVNGQMHRHLCVFSIYPTDRTHTMSDAPAIISAIYIYFVSNFIQTFQSIITIHLGSWIKVRWLTAVGSMPFFVLLFFFLLYFALAVKASMQQWINQPCHWLLHSFMIQINLVLLQRHSVQVK